MTHGLGGRVTKSMVPVMRIHYSADPSKRPGTTSGDAWLTQAVQGYPGGMRCPRWRKEMEIEYGALGGTRIFAQWEQWQLNGKIVVPPFDARGYRLYGSFDYGWRHPSCYLVHGQNGDGEIITLWEFFGAHVPYSAIAKIIKGERTTVPPCGDACHPDARTFMGNPYAGSELYKVADPSIWAEDQQQHDGPMKSTAKLFRQEGVYFKEGERGGDTTIADWLLGYYWLDPLKPLYRITMACPNLIREIGLQRNKDVSAQVAMNRAQPEAWVDKDNDAWDALKYFLHGFPPKPMAERAAEKPGSFMFFREMAIKAAKGEALPSYAIDAPTQREMMG
mgnify:CR=1 FL=1